MSAPPRDASTKTPPGVVLGPDGKPCKPCTSFRAWAKSQRGGTGTSSKTGAKTTTEAGAAAATIGGTTLAASSRDDCPADVEALGRATWTFLHTTAAYYPTHPTAQHRSSMLALLRSLPLLYPCSSCASDFGQDLKANPPERAVMDRESLSRWLCERHNVVNVKLGKEEFKCGIKELDQRWKDGPADGRCD